MLNSKQRAALRSMANTIDPIFWIGKDGIGGNMAEQVSGALETRELIKLAVQENADISAKDACAAICDATGAEPIQCIGRKFVIYRESTKKKKIEI